MIIILDIKDIDHDLNLPISRELFQNWVMDGNNSYMSYKELRMANCVMIKQSDTLQVMKHRVITPKEFNLFPASELQRIIALAFGDIESHPLVADMEVDYER